MRSSRLAIAGLPRRNVRKRKEAIALCNQGLRLALTCGVGLEASEDLSIEIDAELSLFIYLLIAHLVSGSRLTARASPASIDSGLLLARHRHHSRPRGIKFILGERRVDDDFLLLWQLRFAAKAAFDRALYS